MDINTIAQISGIKPHTLRIWEKRYDILDPNRTDGGTRIYTDEDLKTILNLQALSKYGYKISKAASLSTLERHEIIKEKLDQKSSTNEYSLFINEMLLCAIGLDEINFEKYFNQSVIRWGFEDTIISIIYPLLTKIGLLWEIDNISPIEEHFVSQIVVQKIHEAISILPFPLDAQKEYVLFLPENNHHHIPLLFANYILRKNKLKTIYLGDDIPLKNIHNMQGKVNIKNPIFLTFFMFRQEKKSIKIIENIIQNMCPSPHLLIGGELNNLQAIKEKFNENQRIKTFQAMEDFKKIILNIENTDE